MNLPNVLTCARFILIPIYLALFFSDLQYSEYWALGVLLLAGLTDIADGYYARKYRQVTQLGSMLDPLADKLILTVVFISLLITRKLGVWITIAIIGREVVMILGSLFFHLRKNQTLSANIMGKVTTCAFYAGLCAIFLGFSWAESFLWIVVLFSYITTCVYTMQIRQKATESTKTG